VEENAAAGGFGSAVLELLAASAIEVPVATLGVPDRVFEHASQARQRELGGLSPAGNAQAARRHVGRGAQSPVVAGDAVVG
jgi:1-deoxy-D-xylulose-5-phosphate synthase